ncbi:hypothetical protein ACYSNR_04320 [Enterococcus sp. LJL128]
MKRKVLLLVFSLFILFVGGSEVASASEILRPEVRATPMIKEVTLASGESDKISFFAMNNETHCSVFVLKYATVSGEKESFSYRRPKGFGRYGEYEEDFTYSSDGYILTNSNYINYFTGYLEFEITNYSAAPVTYRFGVNAAITKKGTNQVTYGDLDFEL